MTLDDVATAASVLELAAIEHTEARQRGNETHVELTRKRLEQARTTLIEAARAAIAVPPEFRADMRLAADVVQRRSKRRTAPGPNSSTPRHTKLMRLEQALLEYARW